MIDSSTPSWMSKEDPIEVFVSYAAKDNLTAPGLKNTRGLISALVEHLDYIFRKQGPPTVKLWWDEQQIDAAARIDNMIREGIKRSSLLLVIMSRNWLSRPFCRQELALFAERENYEGHIALVRTNHVELDDHPLELKNIRGLNFYSLDNWREAGNERLFFDDGEPKDPQFLDNAKELGRLLWNRANSVRMRSVPAQKPVLRQPLITKNGRTIYLAKSASDTADVYRRVSNELEREGYTVVPPIDQNIPTESATQALEFIDSALRSAEASIHLVGEKLGSKPDDELDHIVRLQLSRAGDRADCSGSSASFPAFQRIVWAPKSPEEACNFTTKGMREPDDVLNRFDRQRPADQLYGDVSSAFLTNLKRDLERRRKTPEVLQTLSDADMRGSRVYLWCRDDDREFARKVRRWLQQNQIETLLPGSDNDADKDKLHRRNLTDCDAVFLCWATATDVWAMMSARELRSWRDLGRREKFAVRGLVLGPPPGESKAEDYLPPIPHEIDEFVDLSKDEELVLDKLKPLLDRSRAALR